MTLARARGPLALLAALASCLAGAAGAYAAPPVVSIEAPQLIDAATGSYRFAGHVNPNGTETRWFFDCTPGCGALAGEPFGPDEVAHAVEEEVHGLGSGVHYVVSLHGKNSAEEEAKASVALDTPPLAPAVLAGTNTPQLDGSVLVRGYVTPNGALVTGCEFLYGATTSYGSSAPCREPVGSGASPKTVTAILGGLAPGSLYHLKLRATNSLGTAESDDTLLATPAGEPSASCANQALRAEQGLGRLLPDCRAYEMVSPAYKNGGQVLSYSPRTRAARNGSAVTFASLAAFGDAHGGHVATEYMAIRDGAAGTSGWATHSISPPQEPMTYEAAVGFGEGLYQGEFTPDLDRGVFYAYSPLTDDPAVAQAHNLYLREDLRTPGIGSYSLLTASATTIPPFPTSLDQRRHESIPVAATSDLSHILFQSELPLTPDSTAEPGLDPNDAVHNLFEWHQGAVRLVGLIPPPGADECGPSPLAPCEPAASSVGGQGGYDDGSRATFVVPVSSSSCPFERPICGGLYMRIGGERTLWLNDTEKTNGLGPGGADAAGPRPAVYWDAAADGSRVFFTSREALTDDAPESVDEKLYMYSLAADGQGHHLTFVSRDRAPQAADPGPANIAGVIGVSNDGRTVYFADQGNQLVTGAPINAVAGASHRLFAWHEGNLSYIGATALPASDFSSSGEVPFPQQSRVTPDGDTLLFTAASGGGLTGYNHGSCTGTEAATTCIELYVYRLGTQRLACVSCNTDGAPPVTYASDIGGAGNRIGGASPSGGHLASPLSDDGRRVFFNSAEALVPEDTNGVEDAYEYDVATNRLHLLSSGTSSQPSFFLDASADGSDAFFTTVQRLVSWDNDESGDLYDARAGGGVPEPVLPVACKGDSCQGPVPPQPPSTTAATAAFAGPGNPRCRAGKRRRPAACGRRKPRHHPHRKAHKRHKKNDTPRSARADRGGRR